MPCVSAQTHGESHLEFEVASIRPSGPRSVRGSGGGPQSSDPGSYHYNRASLLDLVVEAYDVDYFQVSSSGSLDSGQFDLLAKLPPGTTAPQFREMLRNLLAERFNLRSHIESREFPSLALVVAKTGPKLKESGMGSATAATSDPGQDSRFPKLPADRPGMVRTNSLRGGVELVRIAAQQQTMASLALFLRSMESDPIVDATGLTGKYNFTLEFTRELPGSSIPDRDAILEAPPLSIAVQQQLGLQLVARRSPFDVLVVNSFNRMPTEN